jgi:Plasmid pRiA4b ORF-3-like protein
VAQQPVFQLRIRLEGIDPPIWRRVLVPGGAKLSRLHDIFQSAMGWTNSHLHSFTIDGKLYGTQFDDYPEDELDENEHTVSFALRGSLRRFVYEYDFGDSWTHEVVVEDVTWAPYVLKHGVCLDGDGACPPEDVGGPGGYEEFLARPGRSAARRTRQLSGLGGLQVRPVGVQRGGGQRRPSARALINSCPCARTVGGSSRSRSR